jgi:hypothetical protein
LPSVSSYLDGALARSAESSATAVVPPGTHAVPGAVALSAVEARLSRAAAEGDLRGLAELLRKFPDGANARINGKFRVFWAFFNYIFYSYSFRFVGVGFWRVDPKTTRSRSVVSVSQVKVITVVFVLETEYEPICFLSLWIKESVNTNNLFHQIRTFSPLSKQNLSK